MKLPIKYHDGKRIETIRSAIRASARRYSSRTAIMQKFAGSYREISYAELLYKVEGLGTELLERGFYGKKIIIYGESCLEWATVFLAATCGLSVAVTVDKDTESLTVGDRSYLSAPIPLCDLVAALEQATLIND